MAKRSSKQSEAKREYTEVNLYRGKDYMKLGISSEGIITTARYFDSYTGRDSEVYAEHNRTGAKVLAAYEANGWQRSNW